MTAGKDILQPLNALKMNVLSYVSQLNEFVDYSGHLRSTVARAIALQFRIRGGRGWGLGRKEGRPTVADKFLTPRAVKLSEVYTGDSGEFRNMTPHEWWALPLSLLCLKR